MNREIGLFCTGRRFIFDHCDIYARVVWSSVCTTKTDGMVYRNCSFEDKPYNNTEYWPPNLHLIDIPGNYNVQTPMKYTLFDYCDFRVNDDDREMFRIYSLGPGLVPSGDYTTFNHCEFVYDNDGNTTNYGNNIKSSILSDVLFTGNNKL
ncbi:MAG: hypothetical protein IPN14_12710 [Bacteroidetes bacterium]|nr:hypothetical protein [Bacteroidota bacterium]